MSPGEKRRRQAKRERERLAYEQAMAPLRAAGSTCASCKHFKKAPFSVGRGHICEYGSDSDGYQMARASELCPAYAGNVA